jgi:regulator of replication initiation timing
MVDPLHEKMGLLSQQIDDAEEKIRELSDDNQYLQGEVERLCLRAGKNEEEIHRLRQDNLETQSLYSEMYQQNNELTRNFEGLQKEYEDLKQENEVLHERANQLSADLTRFQLKEEKTQEFTSSDLEYYRYSPTPAKTFDNVHASAENTQASPRSASSFADVVKFKSSEKEKNITASKAALNFIPISPENTQASLQSASTDATRYDLNATSYYELSQAISLTGDLPDHQHDPSILTPPVTLIMPNYAAYSSGSKSGEYWVSKPFYSDTQPSYKLCLSVRASGNLSVLIRLVRGEFDLQLDWPFNANITIKLKNHAGRGRNWERQITYRNGNRVTKGTIARGGRGDTNFFKLYENSSFVKDDTLWFEVASIELV